LPQSSSERLQYFQHASAHIRGNDDLRIGHFSGKTRDVALDALIFDTNFVPSNPGNKPILLVESTEYDRYLSYIRPEGWDLSGGGYR
jgi:hypothetical protein